MASRFKFSRSTPPPIIPPIGSWGHRPTTPLGYRLIPSGESDSNALANVAYFPDASDHLVAVYTHHAYWVSDPMEAGIAFVTSDTVKYAVQGFEAHANNNLRTSVAVKIVSENGSLHRITLRTATEDGTELGTSLSSRSDSKNLSVNYTTVSGDRLVVEFLVFGTPTDDTGVQGHNATLRWGSAGAGGDLAENDSQTGTTLNPWIEFSRTITFQGGSAGSTTLVIADAVQSQAADHITLSESVGGGGGPPEPTSWDEDRKKSGKHPWQWIEQEVDRCTLTYGVSPCTATLGVTGSSKCLNGWENCQDRINFSPAPFFIRYSEQISDLPKVFTFTDDGLNNFLPLVQDINHEPGLPDPGASLGSRTKLSVTLQDAPHHDIGIDKYVEERTYDPLRQGSFLRKLKTRFPHYIGRRLRWYQGYITPNTKLADFRRREYIIENVTGPDVSGRVTIVAKDVLKLLDGERAQAPLKSKGKLQTALDATTNYTQLSVVTPDITEYNLLPGETEDYVRISKEIFTYRGTTSFGGGVTLTGVTRDAPSPYSTTRATHDAEDEVQRCRYFKGTIPNVSYELMTRYGDVDTSYITKSDWDGEALVWLAGDDIARLVTEPEKVKDLLNEIIEQTLTWGFWYDEVEQKIRFRAIHPADIGESVIAISDASNIVADSIKLTDTAEKVINEVQILYGQIDPTGSREDVSNYRRGEVMIDADSQGVNETRQRRILRKFGNWHPPANSAVVLRHATRTLGARVKNLFTIEFQLERKDENVRTSQFADLTTMYLINEFGIPRKTRVQVLRADVVGEKINFRAREDFFKSGAFSRWAPAALNGLLYDDATDDQKAAYLFWADDNGKLGTEDDDGKTWA